MKKLKRSERRGKITPVALQIPLAKLSNLGFTLQPRSIVRLLRQTLSPFRLESRFH